MGDPEAYNPTLAHCQALALSFDGRRLAMDAGSKTYWYPAVSGRPLASGSFNYSDARQRIADTGPIPAGTYWIRPDELWTNAWYKSFSNPRSSWGNYRIRIHPFLTTETYGRGGMFIHGGDTPGSRGCIDLTGSMDHFVRDLQAELRGSSTCQIHLKVVY